MCLTLVGNDGYSLVCDLCTPRKSLELSYDDLKQPLLDYINSKPNLTLRNMTVPTIPTLLYQPNQPYRLMTPEIL